MFKILEVFIFTLSITLYKPLCDNKTNFCIRMFPEGCTTRGEYATVFLCVCPEDICQSVSGLLVSSTGPAEGRTDLEPYTTRTVSTCTVSWPYNVSLLAYV